MMTSPARRLTALVARFVAGQPLADFARDFEAFDATFDARTLPAQQRDIYWGLVDLIHLTRPDSAAPGLTREGALSPGSLSESALRDRLRHFRLVGADPDHQRDADAG